MILKSSHPGSDRTVAPCILEAKLDVIEITDLVDSALFNSWMRGSSGSSGRVAVVGSVNLV